MFSFLQTKIKKKKIFFPSDKILRDPVLDCPFDIDVT